MLSSKTYTFTEKACFPHPLPLSISGGREWWEVHSGAGRSGAGRAGETLVCFYVVADTPSSCEWLQSAQEAAVLIFLCLGHVASLRWALEEGAGLSNFWRLSHLAHLMPGDHSIVRITFQQMLHNFSNPFFSAHMEHHVWWHFPGCFRDTVSCNPYNKPQIYITVTPILLVRKVRFREAK